jgi:glutathione synthase/RimK-type ligase-like ATP-grasp enzyme
VPKVKRFTFESEDDLRRVFAEGDFNFPVLVRPNEQQTGLGLVRIDSHDDWGKVLYTRWYRKVHLMTQFVDTETASGAFYKVRVTYIGGKPFIRHCKAATHWLVQGATNDLINERPALEIDLIDAVEGNTVFMEVFKKMGMALDLDLFGADVGFDPETNRLVLFEANASMSMFFPKREGMSQERKLRRQRLQEPAENHLIEYIKTPSAWRGGLQGRPR